MKKALSILLTIVVTIVVFGSSYFIGNYYLGTFDEDLPHQVSVTFIAFSVFWGSIYTVFVLIMGLYSIIMDWIRGSF